MKELFTTYRYPLGCLLFSLSACMIFLILGITDKHEWFGRGGAVVVMFAVAAEFGLSQIQTEKTNERINGLGGIGGPVVKDLNIPPPYESLRMVSHIFVAIGTIIWGFGDWFLSWVICNA